MLVHKICINLQTTDYSIEDESSLGVDLVKLSDIWAGCLFEQGCCSLTSRYDSELIVYFPPQVDTKVVLPQLQFYCRLHSLFGQLCNPGVENFLLLRFKDRYAQEQEFLLADCILASYHEKLSMEIV